MMLMLHSAVLGIVRVTHSWPYLHWNSSNCSRFFFLLSVIRHFVDLIYTTQTKLFWRFFILSTYLVQTKLWWGYFLLSAHLIQTKFRWWSVNFSTHPIQRNFDDGPSIFPSILLKRNFDYGIFPMNSYSNESLIIVCLFYAHLIATKLWR